MGGRKCHFQAAFPWHLNSAFPGLNPGSPTPGSISSVTPHSSPGQVHSPSTFPTPNFTAVIQSELQDTKTGNSGPPAGSCVTHQGERSAMVRNHLLNAFNYCSHHQNSNYNRAGLESKLKLCSVEMLSPKPAVGHGKILFLNNVSIAPLLSATSVLFLRA